jgi:hypothetical protein
MRLNPMSPSWYFNNLAAMYRSKGDFKEALVWAERTVKQDPKYIIGNVHLCSVYYLLGPEVKKQYIDALRNAGLPD